MYKGVGARLADLVAVFLNIQLNETIWAQGDQVISFSLDIQRRGAGRGFERTPSGCTTALEGDLAKLRCGDFSSKRFTV